MAESAGEEEFDGESTFALMSKLNTLLLIKRHRGLFCRFKWFPPALVLMALYITLRGRCLARLGIVERGGNIAT